MCLYIFCNIVCLYWFDFIIWCIKFVLLLSIVLYIVCWVGLEIIDEVRLV